MRRVLAAALATVALLALAPRVLTPGARASSTYRVDAIFDTAKGIIAGQLVKVAGARVGTVADVALTPDYKARIELDVDRRFAPFHADATCTIKPEGLIAENFVQCDPGTPSSPPLASQGDHAPTVSVARTSVPVSLNDLFDIWNVPTADRLTLLVNDLGAGTAGRGEDLNAILRRSNPALSAARSVLAILNRQHDQLAASLRFTDTVIAQLASRPASVRGFLDHAAAVTQRTGARHDQLALAVQRLPSLLDAARPALAQVDSLTAAALPVLDNLHAAAPGLDRLVGDVQPFARAALPTVDALGPDLARARTAVITLTPLSGQLAGFASAALPTSGLLDQLFTSLRARGFVEGLLGFLYYGTSSTSRFDAISHVLGGHLAVSSCSQYATTPQPGCSAGFGGAATAHARRHPQRATHRASAPPAAGGAPTGGSPTGTPGAAPTRPGYPGPGLPPLPPLPPLPRVPPLPQPPGVAAPPAVGGATQALPKLLRYLLG